MSNSSAFNTPDYEQGLKVLVDASLQHSVEDSSTKRHEVFYSTPKYSNTVAPNATLVIIGMRGAGKTTAGLIASTYLRRPLIDTDRVFERHYNTTIREFVTKRGWQAFREAETSILHHLIDRHPTGAVIVLGGGVVDRSENVTYLRNLRTSGEFTVLHVRRQMEDVFAYLSKSDASRTKWHAIGESYRAVWEKRSVLLEECSNFTFVSLTVVPPPDSPIHRSLALKHVEEALCLLLRNIYQISPALPFRSSFSSLTWSSPRLTCLCILDDDPIIHSPVGLRMAIQGVNAVCLLIQTPSSRAGSPPPTNSDDEEIAKICLRVARIHQNTCLPILFSVIYPEDQEVNKSEYLRRVGMGIKLGCSFIELNLKLEDDDILSLLKLPRSPHTKFIFSYKYSDDDANSSSEAGIRLTYERALNLGADFVNITRPARCIRDNFECIDIQRRMSINPHTPIPLSLSNDGIIGRISRNLNPLFSQVTNARLSESSQSMAQIINNDQFVDFQTLQSTLSQNGLVDKKQIHILSPLTLPSFALSALFQGLNCLRIPYSTHYHDKNSSAYPPALLQTSSCTALLSDFTYDLSKGCFSEDIASLLTNVQIRLSGCVQKTGNGDIILVENNISAFEEYQPQRQLQLPRPQEYQDNSNNNIKTVLVENLRSQALCRCIVNHLSPVNAVGPRSSAVIIGANGRIGRDVVYALKLAGLKKIFAIACDSESIYLYEDEGVNDTNMAIREKNEEDDDDGMKTNPEISHLSSTAELEHNVSTISKNPSSIIIICSFENPNKLYIPEYLAGSITGGVVINLTTSSANLSKSQMHAWSILNKYDVDREHCRATFHTVTGKKLPIAVLHEQINEN